MEIDEVAFFQEGSLIDRFKINVNQHGRSCEDAVRQSWQINADM